jgi:serine/threonine protein kinase
MGAVWSARDAGLGREVALKTLRSGGAAGSSSAGLRSLVREAQALARLAHPNVVAVFHVFVHGGRVFLAMELARGSTLRHWLAAAPRSLSEILEVFTLAGRGLAAAHAAGLVHRDFKPDNVLVGSGRVQVSDFGLARHGRDPVRAQPSPDAPGPELSLTTTGTLVGTPQTAS